MQAQYEASKFAAPDFYRSAAGYVEREYGDHGYAMGYAASTGALVIFEVRHSDGSCFNIATDRWDNVQTLSDDPAESQLQLQLMHKNAVAA